MKVVIVEDEPLAADRLRALLRQHDPTIEVMAHLDSVKKAIAWLLQQTTPPDLMFLDIQLGDGLSFEIFDLVPVPCPVVFTTAYNEYALKAFEVNSIDYLLKPLDPAGVARALDKFGQRYQPPTANALRQVATGYGATYKHRFIVKLGEHLKTVPVADVQYFFTRHKGTYAQTDEPRHYLLDYPLDQVEQMVDPSTFFRVNRQYVVRLEAIHDMVAYSNSRLRLYLPHLDEGTEVIVSRDKTAAFKAWLDR